MGFGIDVSHYQNVFNYDQARAAIDFVYIKCTEGTGWTDDVADNHYRGFGGVPRAPYHFLHAGNYDAQMRHFVSFYRKLGKWEWGPVLDCEYSGVTGAAIKAAIAAFRRASGQQLVYVYVGRADLVGRCKPSTFMDSNVRLIAARYYTNNRGAAFANLGFDHPQLDICQYWNAGSIPGISGSVDLNTSRRLINTSGSAAPKQEEDLTPEQARQLEAVYQGLFYGSDVKGTHWGPVVEVGRLLPGMANSHGAGDAYVAELAWRKDTTAKVEAAGKVEVSLTAEQLAALQSAVTEAVKNAPQGASAGEIASAVMTEITAATVKLEGKVA